jgi:FlaA1/EpsC-like NDP-sugar epimerase
MNNRMNNDLILVGGGGHCRSCIDVIELDGKYNVAGIVDQPSKLGLRVLGHKIIATDDDLPRLVDDYQNFLITIGQIESSAKRQNIFEQLSIMGAVFP